MRLGKLEAQTEMRVGVGWDIWALGVKNWRNVDINREDCLKLLKKARVRTELSRL
jgi:hypothetical protein